MNELVSIVVPVYNSDKFLEKCITSLLNQTYKKLEIILVNDGSTDESLRILRKYELEDNRIIVIDQINQGASIARNNGKKIATGEYITFVDSDDWINCDFIEKLVESFFIGVDIVLSGYIKKYKGREKSFIPNQSEWMIFKYSATLGKMYKTNFLKENNINYSKRLIMEDVEFNICCHIANAKYKVIEYAGYVYNINSSSVTTTSQGKFNQLNYALELFNDLEIKRMNKLNTDNFINFYIIHYIYILKMCAQNATFDFLLDSFRKFYQFLKNINKKWYSLKQPKGESKKNSVAIYFFKKLYIFRLTRIFLIIYVNMQKLLIGFSNVNEK